MTTIPTGSSPVLIDRSEPYLWIKQADKLNPVEFIEHTQQQLSKHKELGFKLKEIYASNQLKRRQAPTKILIVFESSLELPFGTPILCGCLQLKTRLKKATKKTTEQQQTLTCITYSMGWKDKVWNILPEHYIKREGVQTKLNDLDVYLIAWTFNSEEQFVKMNEFYQKLCIPLSVKTSYEIIGQLAVSACHDPNRIMDNNILINALKELELQEPITLLKVYQYFSHALKNEELGLVLQKYTQISGYFQQVSQYIL